jgi:hypothetical protein
MEEGRNSATGNLSLIENTYVADARTLVSH